MVIIAGSMDELAEAAMVLWHSLLPLRVLGGGSNVLVSDAGVRGAVILNQARDVKFRKQAGRESVHAESGAVLGSVARRAVEKGLSGIEWAATVPGTVGGAVVGNAGAHGGDVAGSLEMAEILQRDGSVVHWSADELDYAYRDSRLKRSPGEAVVLSADFRLVLSTVEATKARTAEFVAHRQSTQPPGASWGSMFKNPPGDHAGRLIEAAGLKGAREGDVEISTQHGNFFINRGRARASDAWAMITRVQAAVEATTGVRLELEVELLGDWQGHPAGTGAGAQD
jgi:UDP-N-acetylmuramate dehydrogenase